MYIIEIIIPCQIMIRKRQVLGYPNTSTLAPTCDVRVASVLLWFFVTFYPGFFAPRCEILELWLQIVVWVHPMFLAPLIIGEASVPALHNQLELLISWDSRIVTGHFRYLHKCIVKCSHLSMKCIVFQSKMLASSYLPL